MSKTLASLLVILILALMLLHLRTVKPASKIQAPRMPAPIARLPRNAHDPDQLEQPNQSDSGQTAQSSTQSSTQSADEQVTETREEDLQEITYTHNQWGAPSSMTTDGQTYQLNAGEHHNISSLPGGLTLTLDVRGRTSSLARPGFATKHFRYDDSDRISKVLIGERVVESYTYEIYSLAQYGVGEGASAENIALTYDAKDRVTAVKSSLNGPLAEYSYGDTGKTGTAPVKFANRLRTYKDPNGVLATYSYTDNGSIKSITIQNGPSFTYTHHANNELASVSINEMSAQFGPDTHGKPASVLWRYNGTNLEKLARQCDQEGRLMSMGNGSYQMKLTWSTKAKASETTKGQGLITSVVRKAPGFAEIWLPSYDARKRLQSLVIKRFAGGDPSGTPSQVIEESYGPIVHNMIGSLSRKVDGKTRLSLTQDLDKGANQLRWSTQTYPSTSNVQTATYDDTGNLLQISDPINGLKKFRWDGFRRLSGVTMPNGRSYTYKYDAENRRVLSSDSNNPDPLVYFYQGSRVIAIGQKKTSGIVWTHAIGYGPTGPVLIKDLTAGHKGKDYFIFTDYRDTPFAYRDAKSGVVYFTPYSPWGELLAQPKATKQVQETVETAGFSLPPDPVFATTPLGLDGHLLDHGTDLIYMVERYYSPRHGQFITASFREPTIFDPSSTTEIYAYAYGNPVIY